jgi:hypothetical protein
VVVVAALLLLLLLLLLLMRVLMLRLVTRTRTSARVELAPLGLLAVCAHARV